jgi:mono/diheme cytochrome c family protein
MFGLSRRPAALAAIAAIAAAAFAGCGSNVKGERADLVHGKQLFVERCGSCHALNRAGTRGTVGPSLDDSFAQALDDGLERDTVAGVVEEQILNPRVSSRMPADLVTGQDATDVASYVANSAAKGGDDVGALATAVRAVEQRAVAAEGGRLEIDADPSGQLAYLVSRATAMPGTLEIASRNASGTPHDIALEDAEGSSQLGKGATVTNGGVSRVSVSLRPGTYTFYCSVAGHREAGMQGTLTVR